MLTHLSILCDATTRFWSPQTCLPLWSPLSIDVGGSSTAFRSLAVLLSSFLPPSCPAPHNIAAAVAADGDEKDSIHRTEVAQHCWAVFFESKLSLEEEKAGDGGLVPTPRDLPPEDAIQLLKRVLHKILDQQVCDVKLVLPLVPALLVSLSSLKFCALVAQISKDQDQFWSLHHVSSSPSTIGTRHAVTGI